MSAIIVMAALPIADTNKRNMPEHAVAVPHQAYALPDDVSAALIARAARLKRPVAELTATILTNLFRKGAAL